MPNFLSPFTQTPLAAPSGMAAATAMPSAIGMPPQHQGDMGPHGMTRDAFHDLRDQFKDDRQQWKQDGRMGDRPMWQNYLMPGVPGQPGLPVPGQAPVPPQPLPAIQPAPAAPYGGVGTGLGVQGMQMPTNPYAIPGYGG